MRFLYSKRLILGVLIASLGIGQMVLAQTPHTWIGTDGAYDNNTNWDLNAPPTGAFDETAVIDNNGTARVSNTVTEPAQVTLGLTSGNSGSLIIENGGNLTTYDDNPATAELLAGSLGIDVGFSGTGTLIVEPGGSLTAANIIVRPSSGSSVTFDGSGGSPATVTIGSTIPGKASGTNVFAGSTFRVIGPNVNYSTPNFDMEPGSIFIPKITGATHSTISVADVVTLDGSMTVEFDGYSPSVSDTWNLFDTASISGSFSSIQATGGGLAQGQKLSFTSVPNGSLGFHGQLGIEQQLVLKVNRDTGAMSIETGTETVSIDGYTISSNLGGIDSSQWNSLEDQAISDWRESPPGGSANLLAELKPTASTGVTSGSPLALGNVFDLPLATEFGTQELEDIEFQYFLPDGSTVQGDVIYEGFKQHNNLVLVVDPNDGEARLENQSNLSVSIDGYNIHSDSGSLLSGTWSSLGDQAISSWRESNPTANDLTELEPNSAELITGGSFFDLGSPFQTVGSGGTEDLTFQYLLPGDSEFTTGVVVYRDIDGDFNNDGKVDGYDLLAWQRDTSIGNLNDWRAQYGSSTVVAANANVTAVPEPCSLVMCVAFGASLFVRRYRT
ncbi:MAG: hypothetical protein MI725_08515 [Pirellulales bacterium]|nr:hypothetical protein [Pirellulales bacterium]